MGMEKKDLRTSLAPLGAGLVLLLALLNPAASLETSLLVDSVLTPRNAPSVVLCRGQLFASSNDSAIMRIDRARMRVLEVREYSGLGRLHQITTDGRMLYAAYFSKPEDGPPKHGIIKVDPVDLSIRAQLALEPYGVFGFPEGFVWHDGYLFSCAFGIKRKTSATIAKIEPHSMTFVGAVTLPQNEGTHGINYDGSRLYALGVPLFSGTATADRYYRIDPDTLQVEARVRMPPGIYRYGGNVYLPRNGFLYTSPEHGPRADEGPGALVKIDPASFTIVNILPGAGQHWLATEGRYVYLVGGPSVRVVDPDAMVIVADMSYGPSLVGSYPHFGYVAGDGYLYLAFESHEGGPGQVVKMAAFGRRDSTAPKAPTNAIARAAEGVVSLGWTAAQETKSAVLEYRIYRRTLSAGAELLAIVPGAASTSTDRSATPGETYVYQIAAVNSSGVAGPRASTPPVLNVASGVQAGQAAEITLASDALPDAAWVRAVFTSPSGERFTAAGSYDRPGIWKVRFVPSEPGPWRYAVASSDRRMVKFGGFISTSGSRLAR